MSTMSTLFFVGLIAAFAVGTIAIITLLILTVNWLKDRIKKRLSANKRHKVVFADVTETLNSYAKEHMDKQGELSMESLRKMCSDSPYVIADYDIDTGEVLNYTGIRADEVEESILHGLKKRGGLVVFDS